MSDFHEHLDWEDQRHSEEDSDRQSIWDGADPNAIVTVAPKERFKLGTLSVMGLVVNRMIGTGIFNTPAVALQGTQTTGGTLMFWVAGAVYALCGMHVYIEYGLNVPRHKLDGREQGVPRSGGDLNYVSLLRMAVLASNL